MHAKRFLNNFFSCHSKIDILRTVIQSDEPQSGRQIAATAGLSPRSCQLSLDHLVELKVLNRRESGKAYYYSVNLENQIVTDLIVPIIQQEERLTDMVVDEIRNRLSQRANGMLGVYYLESWPRSWADKSQGALLLFISSGSKRVSSRFENKINELRGFLLDTFGLPSEYKVVSREEFKELARNKPSDLNLISRHARSVSGASFRELVTKEKGSPNHISRAVDFFGAKQRHSSS